VVDVFAMMFDTVNSFSQTHRDHIGVRCRRCCLVGPSGVVQALCIPLLPDSMYFSDPKMGSFKFCDQHYIREMCCFWKNMEEALSICCKPLNIQPLGNSMRLCVRGYYMGMRCISCGVAQFLLQNAHFSIIKYHMFCTESLQAENSMPCRRHPRRESCSLPAPMTIDILVASGTCQPFSALKNGCGPSDCRNHKTYGVTFDTIGSVISQNERLLPGISVSEQVKGFLIPYDKGQLESPDSDYVKRMNDICRPDGTKHFVAHRKLIVDSDVFMDPTRYRSVFGHGSSKSTDHHFGLAMTVFI
jgi:hypothetical protein